MADMAGAGREEGERERLELPWGSLLGSGRAGKLEGPASFCGNGPLRDIDGWPVSVQPARRSVSPTAAELKWRRTGMSQDSAWLAWLSG